MRNQNEISKFLAIPVAVAAFLAALGAARVLAKGAREFAGFYRILQATNRGDKVEVRISLRVFNYSEADVKDATISLASFLPHAPGAPGEMSRPDPLFRSAPHALAAGESWEKAQPSFQGVALRVNEHQVVPPLEGTFIVPALEYQQWLKGAQPHFVIDYQDASGKPHHQAIELMGRP
jgi:hypothetical protein